MILSPPSTTSRPIFVLSFRQRDELAAALSADGWQVIAARRDEGTAGRLASSGAPVAIVDARGAIEEGLAAIRRLSPLIEASGGALLALVSKIDSDRIGHVHDAGATHFLLSPMRAPGIIQALRFACRHVERVAADTGAQAAIARAVPVETLGFRYDPADRSLQATQGLARWLGTSDAPSPRMLLRRLSPEDRVLALTALRRLDDARGSTAFAADLPGLGRSVAHLQRDARTRRLHVLIEPLGRTPEPSLALREALADARDANAARRWIERRLAADASVAVILIGIGQFAALNTAFGRASGDQVLGALLKRIEAPVRELFGKAAIVARVGGAEFLAAAATADPARVEVAVARIEAALAAPFLIGDRAMTLDVRSSVAWSAPGADAATMLRQASAALVEPAAPVTAPTDHAATISAQSLDQLGRDVVAALDAHQIDILFQPQVATSTGRIEGVEALVRWRHPALGELGAETLFASAVRAGIAPALSEQVQRHALALAATWTGALARLRLSINVTAEDVARPSFADALLDRIDSSGFPRDRLTVEITESGLMEDLGQAARLLAQLRTAGCRVAIDDFGTGYSSLAYLKALPLDYLKIDRKLSQDIAGSPRDRVVVRGVIDMARALGLTVIAEGVETEEQLDLLAKEGCRYFQGFLCAGPLTVEELAALV